MSTHASYIPESTSTQMAVLPARERELLQLGSPLIQKLKEAITETILQFHRQPGGLQLQPDNAPTLCSRSPCESRKECKHFKHPVFSDQGDSGEEGAEFSEHLQVTREGGEPIGEPVLHLSQSEGLALPVCLGQAAAPLDQDLQHRADLMVDKSPQLRKRFKEMADTRFRDAVAALKIQAFQRLAADRR